jgi:PAS domain S-box-containing protein
MSKQVILLVEDDSLIALAERARLEQHGYRVVYAQNGESAVTLCLDPASEVDLVLMDMNLGPGIDGSEAARRILASRELPIVFLSAHAEREQVELVKGITRYGYVVKGSGDFVLISSIEMALELFGAHRELDRKQAQLTTLLKTIPDLVWLKDLEGRYLAANPAFEGLMGRSEAELLGRDDFDVFGKDVAEAFRVKDREAILFGAPLRFEENVTYPDGKVEDLETIKTPMFDAAGRAVGVLGIGRSITERKRMQLALAESEARARRKLEAVTSPDGSISDLDLEDIVDVPALQGLFEDFSALTGMVTALLDIGGKVLVSTGWRDICVDFHRACGKSAEACTESDLYLSTNLRPGERAEYRCRNGLWDVVTPLFMEGRHVGNIFTGQFFYEDDEVDETAFKAQARGFGYDEEAYLKALRAVPRYSREQVRLLMDFLSGTGEYLSRLGAGNLKLARSMAEKERTEALLQSSVAEKETLLKELQHRVKNSLNMVRSLLSLSLPDVTVERDRQLFQESINRVSCVAMIYERLRPSATEDSVDLAVYLADIARLLSATYGREGARLELDLAPIVSTMKVAVPLGLSLNELFVNAIKHAGTGDAAPSVRVSLKTRDGRGSLSVADDGPGLPEGFDLGKTTSLGLKITQLLAAELGGSLRIENGPSVGAVATLDFASA